jgi:FixJ family two-component response regulator
MTTTIHLVDDEAPVRDALARLFRAHGHAVVEHASAEGFLVHPASSQADCLVLDLRLAGISGLELQGELARRSIDVPIVFLTGHGDVVSGVTAMKAGAVDFLLKTTHPDVLVAAVHAALVRAAERATRAAARARRETLTPREGEVISAVVAGRRTKEIAAALGIEEQTVRIHRMRAMQKLGVDGIAELVTFWTRSEGP